MKIRKSPAFVLPALVPAAGSSLPRRGFGWTVRKSGKDNNGLELNKKVVGIMF